MNISFRNHKLNLFLGLFVLAGLMGVLIASVAYIPRDAEQQGLLAGHTRAVIGNLSALMGHVTDAETGQRGYLFTVQESYLEPYNNSLLQIKQDEVQIEQLLAGDADQLDQLKQLEKAIDNKLAELKETVDAEKGGDTAKAREIVLSGRGKIYMDAIRDKIDRLQKAQRSVLQIQFQSWHEKAQEAGTTIFIGGFILCALIMAVWILLYREVQRREGTEQAQGAELRRLDRIINLQGEIAGHHYDLPTTMHLVASRTQDFTRAHGAAVEMLEGDEMVYAAATGTAEKFVGLRLKASGSLSGQSVSENKILKCDDAENDFRVDRAACRSIRVRSMVVVPLRHNGKSVGVLKVMSSEKNAFNKSDVTSLTLMAGVLSSAISDAQEGLISPSKDADGETKAPVKSAKNPFTQASVKQ